MKVFHEVYKVIGKPEFVLEFATPDAPFGAVYQWLPEVTFIVQFGDMAEKDERILDLMDDDDLRIVDSAQLLYRFYSHLGVVNKIRLGAVFTGMVSAQFGRMDEGIRFFNQALMIEWHVWPEDELHPPLIMLYHYHSNTGYEIKVNRNFR